MCSNRWNRKTNFHQLKIEYERSTHTHTVLLSIAIVHLIMAKAHCGWIEMQCFLSILRMKVIAWIIKWWRQTNKYDRTKENCKAKTIETKTNKQLKRKEKAELKLSFLYTNNIYIGYWYENTAKCTEFFFFF